MINYQEILPCNSLKEYVKCYYTFESLSDEVYEDKAFATGCIEVMFNMGSNRWQIATGTKYTTTGDIELWGQIISPLTFRLQGSNNMIGIRFFPHTAALFIDEKIELFNNRVTDFYTVAGKPIKDLHQQMMNRSSLKERISLIDDYLLKKIAAKTSAITKVHLISSVMNELKRTDFFDNIENLALKYGISSRYLQKLFIQYTGITPKLYSKIIRFQNSLQLVAKNDTSLTSIAYECNYFDQSHFIRDFKTFTGLNPSAFNTEGSSATLIT